MKKVYIYLTEKGKMNEEGEFCTRVQVDNCLRMGWSADDIVIIANFDWSYNGVRTLLYKPESFPKMKKSVKGWYIAELYKQGVLEGPSFITDVDWFQISSIDREVPSAAVDLAIYGVETKGRTYHPPHGINTVCMFTSERSVPFFERLRYAMETADSKKMWFEERAATLLAGTAPADEIAYLDMRYNFFAWNNMKEQYAVATKPLIALHFHPHNETARNAMCTPHPDIGERLCPDDLLGLLRTHGLEV